MRLRPAKFNNYLFFILALAGIGSLIAWLFYQGLEALKIEIPLWLGTSGAIAIAGSIFSLYDKYFWSWKVFKFLGLIDFPDLRGRWSGQILSSHDQLNSRHPAILEIKQSASELLVNLYTEQSQSSSIVATIIQDSDEVDSIRFIYRNEPDVDTPHSMQIHNGSCLLRYFPDVNILRGEYFTSRERSTYGTMEFNFQSKQILGRFTENTRPAESEQVQ